VVDTTAGHELPNFMNAYSGYNHIKMHPSDENKTMFITEQGTTDRRTPKQLSNK